MDGESWEKTPTPQYIFYFAGPLLESNRNGNGLY